MIFTCDNSACPRIYDDTREQIPKTPLSLLPICECGHKLRTNSERAKLYPDPEKWDEVDRQDNGVRMFKCKKCKHTAAEGLLGHLCDFKEPEKPE